ncbi:tripartite tricarboxylate transporter TctB family protein, partial [Rhizobium leguminosarum]|nr:tripartite tricarboxylate transporter TctB family protein [Rhizobium leguminosarum]
MKSISFDTTNAICGALFVATGAFFAIQSLGLDLGTAVRMGTGYFPLAL